MTFSITKAAFEGFRVMRRAPVAVVMWGVTYFVCIALILLAASGAVFSMVSAIGDAEPTAAESFRIGSSVVLAYLIAIPLSVVAASIVVAATCRAVLTPKKPGFFFMRLGGAEFRLMGAYMLIALGVIAAMLLIFGIASAVIGGTTAMSDASAIPHWTMALIYPAYFGFIFFYVWISVRLSLLGPITVAEGQFAIGRAWAASRGRFWVLLDLAAATVVRWFVLYAVAITIFSVLALASFDVIPDINEMDPSQVTRTVLPLMAVGAVLFAGFAALQFTVLSTPFAVFYRDVIAPTIMPEEEPGAIDPRF